MLAFSLRSLSGYPMRTAMMLLAMAVGVASVIVLTALGEGARRYVTGQFSALGTHLLIVLPGRSETTGGAPPLLGQTPRDLTLDDALALSRTASVRRVAPVALGSAPVSFGARDREVLIIGTTPDFREVRDLDVAQGRFLPAMDPRRASPVCVLGAKLRRELFGSESALGRWIRIGDRRFRVVGILADEGSSIGIDLGDMAVVPVAAAQALFDTPSLFRILVEARTRTSIDTARERILSVIRTRHDGEDDVTVITQDAVVATFDRILRALTWTLSGIASVSLVVAGILIMNVMLVAVSQRTPEIGLLKAIGAPPRTVLALFLAEATLLALAGAAAGVAAGEALAAVARELYPLVALQAPRWAIAASVAVAIASGLVFGAWPARRAARLDPVAALGGH